MTSFHFLPASLALLLVSFQQLLLKTWLVELVADFADKLLHTSKINYRYLLMLYILYYC
jgi:hypothetical protein